MVTINKLEYLVPMKISADYICRSKSIFEISLMDDANNILYVTQANLTSSNMFIDPYDPPTQSVINSSNNNPAYAKTNDVITVVLNTDEPINNVSATMLGRTPNITVFNDTVVMYTTVLQNDIDNATFSITAFDFAGNSLNVSQHDLNSTNVLIDNVSPYSTILTINSTNPNTSYAKTTDTITVTLIANEILSNATSVILGRNSNVMLSNNIVITNMSIMDGDDGNATFAIIISDLAGNMHSVTESDLDSDNIIIDTIAPSKINLTISNNFNSAMATTGNILNITLETNEIIVDATATILNRPANYIIQNDTVYASTTVQKNDPNENTTFAISVFDPSGNYLSVTKSDLDSNNIIIDTIAPSITNLMLSSNNANSILSESRSDSVTECILPAKSEMIMANVALPSSPSIIDIFVITMLFDSMTFELRPSITEVALDRISFAINVTVIVSVVFAYDVFGLVLFIVKIVL